MNKLTIYNSSKMQCKGLWLSLVMLVAIGTVSVSTSVEGHNVDLDGTDAMEELALIMAAAAGQEFIANAMGRNFLFIIVPLT